VSYGSGHLQLGYSDGTGEVPLLQDFKSRRTKGTVVTTETRDSTYMSTGGSMVQLLLKEEPIAACGRLVTGTNYPTLFLAKPKDNPSIGHRLNPQDATCTTAAKGVS
jgi:hypothetical protein